MTTDSVSVSYVSDCEKSCGESMDTLKSVQSMNWDTVKKFHLNPPKIQLPREDSVIQRYKENMSIIKMTHTIPEYIMEKYFSTGKKVILTANDYPYFTTSNVVHYLLWIHPSVVVDNGSIKELIIDKMPLSLDCQEFIYFENDSHNKSILDIRHFHVFIRVN